MVWLVRATVAILIGVLFASTVAVPSAHAAPSTTMVSFVGNLDARAREGTRAHAPFRIVDSLGRRHVLIMQFTKVTTNMWSWQVITYDRAIASPNPLASGRLTFDMSGHAQTIRGQAEGAMILTFTNGAEDAIGDRTIWIEMDNSVSGRPESSRVRVGQSTEADGEVQSTPSAPMPTQMPATPTPIPTAAATSTPVTQATRTPTPRATSTPRPVRTPRPRNARMLLLQGSPGRFYPRTLVIPAGSTMTWRNGDRREHTVTLGSALRSDGSPIPVSFDFHLDSRPNRRLPGVEYNDTSPTITFAEPGTYDVFCSLAPAVQATIVVR